MQLDLSDQIMLTPPPRSGCGSSPSADGGAAGWSLVDLLLAEQQEMSAAERFADWHAQAETAAAPAQAKFYRELLPAAPPGPGQQYAFDVDLDRCSGCKACVTACHTLNGLDERETWRSVGLLSGGSSHAPALQHVTAACHHCLEPACLAACPVNAYVKDPQTGIVKHLDDQCFGCKYCTLACPYEVPQYHRGKGIVRKCDMCSTRLAAGEAPACVQACPHEAIRIQVVDVQQVAEDAEAAPFLPAAPDPQITLPTTTYRTRQIFPRNMLPADYFDVSPQSPHWPLVIMLALTQLSVGAFLIGLSLERLLPEEIWRAMRPLHAGGALLVGLVALGASTLHLGRPQYAFRAVLGLRHSWLSREIVAFGLFAKLACAYAAAVWWCEFEPLWAEFLLTPLAWSVSVAGVLGVGCSGMIYVFTQRDFWSPVQVGMKFTLTTILLGVASIWLSLLLCAVSGYLTPMGEALWLPTFTRLLIAVAAVKLIWEAALFRHLLSRRMTSLRRSALLMTRELSNVALLRFALGLLGGIIMPALLLPSLPTDGEPVSLQFLVSAAVLFAACLGGELLERYLFFAAVAAPRMPGGVR